MSTTLNAERSLTVSATIAEPPISIASEHLRTMQWWAALLTIGVPSAVTALAVALASRNGVGAIALVAWGVMHLATMVGITAGYHRLLAHRAFDAHPIARALLIILGSMAAEGPAVHWVSNHRRHHQFSDKPGDVHTPHGHGGLLRGFVHAHIGWMFSGEITNSVRYSKDLLKDPAVMRLHRLYPLWVLLGVVAPAAVIGIATWSWTVALDVLLWAGFVRIFTVHHATWAINSLTHLWGTRPFKSADKSVNVAWLAIPSAGESWHNGHHTFPSSARFGMRWWQLDLGYVTIRSLELLGLATNVRRPSAGALRRAAIAEPSADDSDL